jgi:hypothetical protein
LTYHVVLGELQLVLIDRVDGIVTEQASTFAAMSSLRLIGDCCPVVMSCALPPSSSAAVAALPFGAVASAATRDARRPNLSARCCDKPWDI